MSNAPASHRREELLVPCNRYDHCIEIRDQSQAGSAHSRTADIRVSLTDLRSGEELKSFLLENFILPFTGLEKVLYYHHESSYDNVPNNDRFTRGKQQMRQEGARLFHRLFTDGIEQDFIEALKSPTTIVKVSGPPEFVSLCWDCVRDPVPFRLPKYQYVFRVREPWSCSTEDHSMEDVHEYVAPTYISQSVPAPEQSNSHHVNVLRILFLTSRPDGSTEDAHLVSRICRDIHQNEGDSIRIEVYMVRPASVEELTEYLKGYGPDYFHVLHFDGHCKHVNGERFLIFEGDDGGAPVSRAQVEDFCTQYNIQIVILDACSTAAPSNRSFAADLCANCTGQAAQVVIAMRFPIVVTSATRFWTKFYSTLARAPYNIAHAFTSAVEEICSVARAENPENPRFLWMLPVFFSRTLNFQLNVLPSSGWRMPPPVCEFGFVGRCNTVERICRSLYQRERGLVCVGGFPMSGKTTVLLQTCWTLEVTHCIRDYIFLAISEEGNTLQLIYKRLSQMDHFLSTEELTQFCMFRSDCEREDFLVEALRANSSRAKQTLIVLDNMEFFMRPPCSPGLFPYSGDFNDLKGFLSRLITHTDLKIIVCTSLSLQRDFHLDGPIPIYNHTVDGLDDEGSTELVRSIARKMEIPVNENDIDALINEAQGSPPFLRVAVERRWRGGALPIVDGDEMSIRAFLGQEKHCEKGDSGRRPLRLLKLFLLCLHPFDSKCGLFRFRKLKGRCMLSRLILRLRATYPNEFGMLPETRDEVRNLMRWAEVYGWLSRDGDVLKKVPYFNEWIEQKVSTEMLRLLPLIMEQWILHYEVEFVPEIKNLQLEVRKTDEQDDDRLSIVHSRWDIVEADIANIRKAAQMAYEKGMQGVNCLRETFSYYNFHCGCPTEALAFLDELTAHSPLVSSDVVDGFETCVSLMKSIALRSNGESEQALIELRNFVIRAYALKGEFASGADVDLNLKVVRCFRLQYDSYEENLEALLRHDGQTLQREDLIQIADIRLMWTLPRPSFAAVSTWPVDAMTAYGCCEAGLQCMRRWMFDDAISFFKKSMEIRNAIGDRFGVASCLHYIGKVYLQRNTEVADLENAVRNFEEALNIKLKRGFAASLGITYHHLGRAYMALGKHKISKEYFTQAHRYSEFYHRLIWRGFTLLRVSELYFLSIGRNNNEARSRLKEALNIFEREGDEHRKLHALRLLGILEEVHGDGEPLQRYKGILKAARGKRADLASLAALDIARVLRNRQRRGYINEVRRYLIMAVDYLQEHRPTSVGTFFVAEMNLVKAMYAQGPSWGAPDEHRDVFALRILYSPCGFIGEMHPIKARSHDARRALSGSAINELGSGESVEEGSVWW